MTDISTINEKSLGTKNSVKRKLMKASLLTMGVALAVTVLILLANEAVSLRHMLVENLMVQANIVASNSTSSILFNSEKDAEETLSAFQGSPSVLSAVIYTIDGSIFAKYQRYANTRYTFPNRPESDGYSFSTDSVSLFHGIVLDGKRIGTLYVESDLNAVYSHFLILCLTASLALLVSFMIAAILLSRLQTAITVPVLKLSNLMSRVSSEENYTVRAPSSGLAEVDTLAKGFNAMLAVIQQRDEELLVHRQHLEELVHVRTMDLKNAKDRIEEELAERKLAEEAILRERVFTDAILASVPGLLYLYDDKGFLMRWNKKHEEMTGYSADELSHVHVLDWFKGDEKATALITAGVQRTFQDGYVAIEADLTVKSGARIPFYFTGVRLSIDGKSYLVGVGIDITERKKAEEALRQSEEKYRTLFEESKDTIFFSTPEGKYLDINPAGIEMLGYSSREEVLGLNIPQQVYVNPDARKIFLNIANQKGFVKDFEIEMKKKDGTKLTVLSTATAVRNERGEIIAYRGIRRDITEHKRLEQQLLQAQKMEVVGQLAGGIAHDFNNILTAIIGYGHLLQMKVTDDDSLAAHVEQILEAANRAAEITHSLLAFSRKQLINSGPVDINDSIRRVEKLLCRLIGEDVEVSVALNDEDMICMADAGQIEQVLMNLATNARDAMPNGGKLTISAGLTKLDDAFVQDHGCIKPGMYAHISVADTGMGMAQETSEKIFEPFFTTKETGKGTGLGLAMVYGIIKQHNGCIHIHSELGKGTIFHVYLPAAQSEEKVFVQPSTNFPQRGGTETILVAEDDERLRKLYETVLTHSGYKVIMAEDGEEAIKKFIENRDEVQLSILDMIMPKKGGKEAYDEILKIKPETKLIFLSGHTADRLGNDGVDVNKINLITKPVSPKDLLSRIREVLDK